MKKIFLTGATGVMGSSGLKELTGFPERYEITVLARDSKKNRKQLASYIKKGVRVIWGDLLDPEAIDREWPMPTLCSMSEVWYRLLPTGNQKRPSTPT